MARLLDDQGKRALQAAVESIEAASAAEAVVVVPVQSGRYLHADLLGAIACGWLALGFLLLSRWSFSLASIWLDPLACGLIGGGLVARVPALRRWLTPAKWRRDGVLRGAQAAFVERRISETRDRSGLLIYISQLEREAVVLADLGLRQAVSSSDWQRLESALSSAARASDASSAARALSDFALVAQAALPRRADDQNELADSVVSE
jgi:putative membrane protein